MDPVTLAQAGPVAILLAGIGLLARAFIRGDVVPGWIYRKAEERAERAEAALAKTVTTIERSTDDHSSAKAG